MGRGIAMRRARGVPPSARFSAAAAAGLLVAGLAVYGAGGSDGTVQTAALTPPAVVTGEPELQVVEELQRQAPLPTGTLGPGTSTVRPAPRTTETTPPTSTTGPTARPTTGPTNRPTKKPAPRPTTGPPAPRPTVTTALSSLDPTSVTSGWGPYERNRSNGEEAAGDGRTLTIAGVTYSSGLGVHADSTLRYQLDGRYLQFRAVVGMDDESCAEGDVTFTVVTDGRERWTSPVMRPGDAGRAVSVSLTGVQVLELVVGRADSDITCDHADWAGAVLTRQG